MDNIGMSEGFCTKLVNGVFGTKEVSFVSKPVYWLIDSKYRNYKRLDFFLKEQLVSPDKELLVVAKELKKKYGQDTDRLVIAVLKYVTDRTLYFSDEKNYGKEEYWATAIETFKRRRDDCDGINALIYVLCRLCGVPSYLLWEWLGDTPYGGHYSTFYLSPQTHIIYAVDGTLFADFTPIKDRTASIDLRATYKELWYLFNEDFCFQPK